METKYKGEGFFRIGSSKEKLSHYPEWELRLSNSLSHGIPSITNTQAPEYANSLTFQQLFMYYGARGLELRKETFAQTLKLKTAGGEWNVLAYILSDQNSIPIRVSIFSGTEKYDPLFSVREFGNKCILYSLNQILEYGDTINLAQADERGRVNERKDQPLFDYEAFHEAVLNAFVHNKWVTLNGPSFSVFSNRVEILSVGGLAPEQTRKGFFEGASLPVNEALASLFLQLRLSERSGRGVPKIVHAYGQDSIDIEKNYVKVTIPFLRIGVVKYRINPGKVEDKVKFKSLTKGQNNVLSLMRDNPNITVPQIATKTGLSFPGIYKIIKKFKDEKILQRIGSRKNGYWKVEKEPYVNDKS